MFCGRGRAGHHDSGLCEDHVGVREARAYRAVLLEAGHLSQTMAEATRLGLAPFRTAAIKVSLIDKNLRLESVLYVAGAGLVACPPHEPLRRDAG